MNEPGAYWITVDKADFSDFDADHGYKFAVNFTWTQELMDQLNLNAAFDGAGMVLEGFTRS